MSLDRSLSRGLLAGLLTLFVLLLPSGATIAQDVNLFQSTVPPNILFFVDNSSSMTNGVYHPDWSGTHTYTKPNGNPGTRGNSKQTECQSFRVDNMPDDLYADPTKKPTQFSVFNVRKTDTYRNLVHQHTAGGPWHQQVAYYRTTPQAWELAYPIRDLDGTPLYRDLDANGAQDPGEDFVYHRMLNPATTGQSAWDEKTGQGGGAEVPIEDYDGTHLFYDRDGDGNYESADGDRYLYYELKGSNNPRNGAPKGSKLWVPTFIKPLREAQNAGIDRETLHFASGSSICGHDVTGYSMWGSDDPNAGSVQGNKVVGVKFQYLDFLFSSYGAAARVQTFDVERDYTLLNSSGLTNPGKRKKADCVTLLNYGGQPEPEYYWTYRRSRTQALQLIMRQIVCRVNEVTDTGVRFGFSQFRYHGKPGDDNGAYVVVPVMDWYSDKANGVQTTYTLHGITATHEEHLQRVITSTTPDAQTPLNEGLFQLYTYFMSRKTAELPWGRDWRGMQYDGVELTPAQQFPVYNYDMSVYDPWSDPSGTPSSLYEVGGKFMGSDPNNWTEDASVPAVGATVFDGFAAPDPIQYPCQKNFILIITDGGSAGDDFTDRDEDILAQYGGTHGLPADFDTGTDRGYAEFYNLIGDHFRLPDPANPVIGQKDENKDEAPPGNSVNLLDDIALFMNRYDMRPDENDMPGKQTIDTYTVGYALADEIEALGLGATDDLPGKPLQKAAIRGNGQYFESADADELENDLVVAISEMLDKAQAFTSATVPASRTTDGNFFYSSYFLPEEGTGFWEGHLKSFEFTALGDIIDANGFCATGDQGNIRPNPTCQTGGSFNLFASGFWDAADEIPLPADRALFTNLPTDQPFAQPTQLTRAIPPNFFNIQTLYDGPDADLLPDDGDEFSPPYSDFGYTTSFEVRDALVDVLRGCEFGSSPCVYRQNDEQTHKTYLGDIFHSNPIVIGSPNAPINEYAYRQFSIAYRTRPRVIYAGANDGLLHGFHAGTWQTQQVDAQGVPTGQPLIPARHDAGTGEELMGYMPAKIREVIKELPKQTGGTRQMETVDGSPIVADVWFPRTLVNGLPVGTMLPLATEGDKVMEQWRSVLISGLRNGGRSYYALDITNPAETAAAVRTGSQYPLQLWNFPCEFAVPFCQGSTVLPATRTFADYMGYTWSEPVITKIKVDVTGGDPGGHERWVAIFGAGYDTQSDPNDEGTNLDPADDYDVTALRGRAIFMVDVASGGVLATKYFDDDDEYLGGNQVGFKEMKYAFAAAPAVFDLDFDGFADVVYITDLGGQIWKWVIHPHGDDPINDVAGSVAQPNWPFRLFYDAQPSALPPERQTPAGAYDPTIHYQSFFFPPTGALVDGKLHIALGAGERANPTAFENDGSSLNNNRYFVIRDSDPFEVNVPTDGFGMPIPRDTLSDAFTETDLVDLDSPSGATCNDIKTVKHGYYLTARDSEKFITNSVVFLGELITGSFIPPDPANTAQICQASGAGWLYRFELACGQGQLGQPSDLPPDQRRTLVGGGIPTRPRVSVGDLNQGGGSGGGGDCKNKIVMITSDGGISNDCPGQLDGAGINVRSWRQR